MDLYKILSEVDEYFRNKVRTPRESEKEINLYEDDSSEYGDENVVEELSEEEWDDQSNESIALEKKKTIKFKKKINRRKSVFVGVLNYSHVVGRPMFRMGGKYRIPEYVSKFKLLRKLASLKLRNFKKRKPRNYKGILKFSLNHILR